MKALLVLVVVLSLFSGAAWAQCTHTIGDGVNLSASEMATIIDFFGLQVGLGPDWTLCIAPGVYELDPAAGWPLVLPAHAPEIVGADGAEGTVLVGDGSMGAFLLADGAQARFRGLTFRSFGEAIALDDCLAETSLDFTDNIVEYCEHGLRLLQHDAVVLRNIFRHNSLYGVSCSGVRSTLEDNEICYNGYGIMVIYLSVFTGNHVHHNLDFGLSSHLHDGVIDYNLFEYNGSAGLQLGSAGASEVSHNILRWNGVGVEYYLTGATRGAFFRSNDLYGNALYDFECVAPGSPHTIDATLNWWGTTDPVEIAGHIYDSNDDPAIAYSVAFDPWCDEPGCSGAVPVEQSSWGSIKGLYR